MATKIYLAKSNKSNPNHVIHVRQFLEDKGYEVVEFLGGQYSDAPMLECEAVVSVVTQFLDDEKQLVGRGLYDQASVCIYGEKPLPFYIFLPHPDYKKQHEEKTLSVVKVIMTERKEGDSWIEYGYLYTSKDINSFVTIHPPKVANPIVDNAGGEAIKSEDLPQSEKIKSIF